MVREKMGQAVLVMTVAFFVSSQTAQAKKPDDVNVVMACKADCPDAKNNAEAHECAERKGKIRPSFKKTKCWEVNEEYEQLIQAAPAKTK